MDFDSASMESSMRNYMPTEHIATPPKKKPKRPHNAFNLYFLDKQPQIKVENPLLGGNEVSKKIGEMWKALSEEEKKPYNDRAKKIYEQFKLEHPDYHYDKSSDKKMKKRENVNLDPFFYSEINGLQSYIDNTSQDLDVQTVLMWVGAVTMSKYVLSRRDIMDEISQSIGQPERHFDNAFDVGQN